MLAVVKWVLGKKHGCNSLRWMSKVQWSDSQKGNFKSETKNFIEEDEISKKLNGLLKIFAEISSRFSLFPTKIQINPHNLVFWILVGIFTKSNRFDSTTHRFAPRRPQRTSKSTPDQAQKKTRVLAKKWRKISSDICFFIIIFDQIICWHFRQKKKENWKKGKGGKKRKEKKRRKFHYFIFCLFLSSLSPPCNPVSLVLWGEGGRIEMN